jgi:hypothetical protein
MGEVINLDETLNSRQQVAVLLLAQGHSYADASERAKVSIGTLYNWKSQNTAFRSQLETLQRQLYTEGVKNLQALVGQATETLRAAMAADDSSYRDKIAAARTVYQYAGLDMTPVDTGPDTAEDENFEATFNELAELVRSHAG